MKEETVAVRFTTSYQELVAALRAINRVVPLMRRLRRLSWAAIAVIAVLVVSGVLTASTAVTLLFIPGLALILFWILPFQLAWMTRRRSPYWTGEQHFEFSRDGIRVETPSSETALDWDAVTRTVEGRRFLLFFSSDQGAHFIPKRALNKEDQERVRSLFRECTGKPGARNRSPLRTGSAVNVQVRFELDPAEVHRAGMAAARRTGGLWASYAIVAAVVLWTTIQPAYTQWQRGGWSAVSIPLLVLGLAPLLILIVGVPIISRWTTRRALRSSPSSRGVQEIGVGEWGLRVAGPMYNGELRWSAFMKMVETEEFFLFFVSKIQPVFVPKRLLTSAEISQIRALARAGLGEATSLLSGEA